MRHRPLQFGRRDDHDLNKHQGIRAGLAWEPERSHRPSAVNNANIIVFPARFITNDEAVAMLDAYFAAQFEGGRHQHHREDGRTCGVAAENSRSGRRLADQKRMRAQMRYGQVPCAQP